MARKRISYQERISRAMARGFSRSQARGHARKGEPSIREMESSTLSDKKMRELRELSLEAHAEGRKWKDDPWFDIPQRLIDELSHAARDFIFGY